MALCAFIASATTTVRAQRIQQKLGRGVVAVKNGSSVFVSWRKLAQEPEDVQYNVYARQGGGSYAKVNAEPLTVTNLTTTTSKIPTGSDIAVALVTNGVEQPLSQPYAFKDMTYRSCFLNITYQGGPLENAGYKTKFIWPADLTGNGEYDYVVDRLSLNGGNHMVEAYTNGGEWLWTIDMGPNVNISSGHNDMVLAYDMDCDGKAEVVMKTSDGTRFWNKTAGTWGKYAFGKDTGDTDGDGITDYNANTSRNPPSYMTCVNGLTGEEMATVEFNYPGDGTDQYTRDNRADYMGDGYNQLDGHMGVAYLDGVHPSVVMEYMDRTTDKTHHYYVTAWGFDFSGGKAGKWQEKFTWSRNDKTPWPAEFHHIRIGDVDFDGKDEMLEGGFTVDNDGTMLFSAGISHGDRFRVGDIDPERPGLETFAIQQYASDLLGQLIYDAANGEPIKKFYLAANGDVGRGECMDVDRNHKGYEFWSTMGNLYDCKGNIIAEGEQQFPAEGVWWDGEPDRQSLSVSDGNGQNCYIQKFNVGRQIEFSRLSGWTAQSYYAGRPNFFGDIMGDWREEIILNKMENGINTGFYGYTTDYASDISMYCLQEDPNYRMQCTTRGYYQSPFPSFYLGFDMPLPPLPPSMSADLVWQNGTEWGAGKDGFTTMDRSTPSQYTDGKSVIFSVDGNDSQPITVSGAVSPAALYIMSPKGKHYKFNGNGSLAGTTDLWKSMAGEATVNIPLAHTGRTIISEGTLTVNNTIAGTLDIRARGTIAGNPTVNGNVLFEGALNYEGCRMKPGTEEERFGVMTFNKGLTIDKTVYYEADLLTEGGKGNDLIQVNGDFNVTGNMILNIKHTEERCSPGEYALIKWTGAFNGSTGNFNLEGLAGHYATLKVENNALVLVINSQRAATDNVYWTGAESGQWNYETENFEVDNTPTTFVAGDGIVFGDKAVNTAIVTDEAFEVKDITFENNTKAYEISGKGGFSGATGLTKNGAGTLTINNGGHSFSGPFIVNEGTVTVAELADAGCPSSIGAAAAAAENLQLGKCTFDVNNANTGTTRGVTLNDTVNVNIIKGTTAFKGIVTGTGTLCKTGAGQLNLTYPGVNPYTETILENGIMAQSHYASTFGKSGSKITVKNGTLLMFDNNSLSEVPSFNHNVTIPGNGKLTFVMGSRCNVNGSFSGEGTVNLNVKYVRGDMRADWSGFTGTLNISGDDFRLNQNTDMSKATVTLGTLNSMTHVKAGSGTAGSYTSKFGSLATTSTTVGLYNGTYKVGYNNASTTFAGKISAQLHKYGTGTLTLTGTDNSGATLYIYEGTVSLNNTVSAGVAAGDVVVQNGGTLRGKGSCTNITVNNGGTLATYTSDLLTGTLTTTGNLTVNSGGTITVKISTRADKYAIGGKAAFNGEGNTLRIIVKNKNRTWKEGEEFNVISATNGISGTLTLTGDEPGEGFEWDDSDLCTTGILRVKLATGIKAVNANVAMVSPRIVENVLNVNLSSTCNGTADIQITGPDGATKYSDTFDATIPHTINMEGWAKGVYLVRLSNNGETTVVKVIKK